MPAIVMLCSKGAVQTGPQSGGVGGPPAAAAAAAAAAAGAEAEEDETAAALAEARMIAARIFQARRGATLHGGGDGVVAAHWERSTSFQAADRAATGLPATA